MLTALSIVSLDQGKIRGTAETPDQAWDRLAGDAVDFRPLGALIATGAGVLARLAGRRPATPAMNFSRSATD